MRTCWVEITLEVLFTFLSEYFSAIEISVPKVSEQVRIMSVFESRVKRCRTRYLRMNHICKTRCTSRQRMRLTIHRDDNVSVVRRNSAINRDCTPRERKRRRSTRCLRKTEKAYGRGLRSEYSVHKPKSLVEKKWTRISLPGRYRRVDDAWIRIVNLSS